MYSIDNYIKKKGVNSHWKIYPRIERNFSHAIVIPSYGEYEYLPNLLKSIEKNDPLILKEIIVIIVINNSEKTDGTIKNNNNKTYELLINNNFNYSIGIVDAFSKNLEIPYKNAGVGFARKIGMDLVLPHLTNENSLFFSTDADTIIDKNYFKVIINYFNHNNVKAAVVGFKHVHSKKKSLKKEIINYEKILTDTAMKIKDSGSPYGYVAMGSAMICNKNAYVSIGGMPNKKATEDFYFLQQLAKYCGVNTINQILVYPSSRSESRVFLGTGHRMIESNKGFEINSLAYSEYAFSCLKKWLNIGTSSWKLDLIELFEKTNEINMQLTNYITKENIETIWPKLQFSSTSEFHFINQFHRWFDGLKTMRFLKYFTLKSNS